MLSSTDDSNVIPYEFGKKRFPCRVDGKLNTLQFLDAATGVVKLIEKLGSAFSPLQNDMLCNIEKIKKSFDKKPTRYIFIEDLILTEKSQRDPISVEALLWLRRALHFILIVFENIINDEKKSENLQDHMTSAYSQSLEPYHGWIARNLFKFFKNLMPRRSDLLMKISGEHKECDFDNLLKHLKIYCQNMRESIDHIKVFYETHDLDSKSKA